VVESLLFRSFKTRRGRSCCWCFFPIFGLAFSLCSLVGPQPSSSSLSPLTLPLLLLLLLLLHHHQCHYPLDNSSVGKIFLNYISSSNLFSDSIYFVQPSGFHLRKSACFYSSHCHPLAKLELQLFLSLSGLSRHSSRPARDLSYQLTPWITVGYSQWPCFRLRSPPWLLHLAHVPGACRRISHSNRARTAWDEQANSILGI
jgi:hypothetical protein